MKIILHFKKGRVYMSKFYFTEEQDVRVDEIIENAVEDNAVENKEIEEKFKEEEQVKPKHTLGDENLEIKYFWVRTL